MTTPTIDDATLKFREGLHLAVQNLAADALHAFLEVTERWPAHELADDALYNVGACYLALNQFQRADETFGEVIARYPHATLAREATGGRESGRTAAKAWLGRVSARLGLGDPDGAREAASALEAHADARVHPSPGVVRTFHEIASSLIAAATESLEDVDEVTPADVVADG
jgi:tetratricopeptide (TPR) repeat protein